MEKPMTTLGGELIPACYVCGKIWRREDVKEWYFFNGTVVCRHHPGAEKWYDGAKEMANAKFDFQDDKENRQ